MGIWDPVNLPSSLTGWISQQVVCRRLVSRLAFKPGQSILYALGASEQYGKLVGVRPGTLGPLYWAWPLWSVQAQCGFVAAARKKHGDDRVEVVAWDCRMWYWESRPRAVEGDREWLWEWYAARLLEEEALRNGLPILDGRYLCSYSWISQADVA